MKHIHIHIVGICGTFMGNLALLARELGFRVTGSDLNAYPPMSDMLSSQNIEVAERYHPDNIREKPDIILIGNTISRSNPEINAVMNSGIPYTSGPQWLYDNILINRKVAAVAGTHGKSTTTSMIAWILEFAGKKPGYLIGGVAQNFDISARVGSGEWFVVEGDEYDTAYFDKRSKFIHYRPKIATLLNLEFDHADIFNSIEDIEQQFQYFIRTLPSNGRLVSNFDDTRLHNMKEVGEWTPVDKFSVAGNRDADWYVDSQSEGHLKFEIHSRVHGTETLEWSLPGRHNSANALAAVAAASHMGIDMRTAVTALEKFKPVKRRLELICNIDNIKVYDDFAHHPTAIRASLEAISKSERPARLVAVFEPRSNTMRMGVHGQNLFNAFEIADLVYMYRAPNVEWEPVSGPDVNLTVFDAVETLLESLATGLIAGDCVVIMSNGGFNNLQRRLVDRLKGNKNHENL